MSSPGDYFLMSGMTLCDYRWSCRLRPLHDPTTTHASSGTTSGSLHRFSNNTCELQTRRLLLLHTRDSTDRSGYRCLGAFGDVESSSLKETVAHWVSDISIS
jgi:hypothetical protein